MRTTLHYKNRGSAIHNAVRKIAFCWCGALHAGVHKLKLLKIVVIVVVFFVIIVVVAVCADCTEVTFGGHHQGLRPT